MSKLSALIKDRRGPKVAFLDGGMGTALSAQGLSESAAWSAGWRLHDPQIRTAVERAYIEFLDAGVDILTVNTYNVSAETVVRGSDSQIEAQVLARSAIRANIDLARTTRDAHGAATTALLAVSLGSFGTTIPGRGETANRESTNAYRVPGYGVDIKVLEAFHARRVAAALPTNPDQRVLQPDFDILAFETIPDLLEAQAIVNVIKALYAQHPTCRGLDVWVSFTCSDARHVDNGQLFAECVDVLLGSSAITGIGINCTEPHLIAELLQTLAERQRHIEPKKLAVCYPNSGERYLARPLQPGETNHWHGDGADSGLRLAASAPQWIDLGCQVLGGCCRVTAQDLAALRAEIWP